LTDLKQTVAELEQRLQASLAECDELLQQRAATNEVLQVINASSGDLAPVFDAILERAMRLCEAEFGLLATYDGGQIRTVATRGVPPAFAEFRKNNPPDYGPGTGPARILAGERVVHIADLKSGDAYRAADPNRRAVVDLGGARTVLLVPLLKNESVLGYITIYRQEVRPYSDKQIVLLQNFADQAMIAIENARLFKEAQDSTAEVTEALERQTATSEILRVISQSPTDVQPVFDAIVQTAARLIRCDIAFVLRCDGATFSPAAAAGPDGPLPDLGPSHLPIDPGANFPSRAIVGKKNVHLPDWSLIDLPEHERQIQTLIGVNSALFLPLLREDECIGVLALAGKQANIFGESEIALAESFRDQALIAIENVRLFNEVQAKTRDLEESLQQQIATADVLKVISRSAFDLGSVMNTLTHSAAELCKAEIGALYLREGDVLVALGVADADPAQADFLRRTPLQNDGSTYVGRTILAGAIRNIADVANETEIGLLKRFSEALGFRSILFVPLMREGRGIGVFALARKRTGQFSQREVDLVQTFADQAVIAIENVRLFDEVQARTRELAKSLDDLRAAQDRLVQTEKLASLGQLTAGIAHEIKNPLNFVNNFSALSAELVAEMSDVLAKTSLDVATREEFEDLGQMLKSNLEKVVQHGKRADSIIKNMLQHSREGSSEHRSVDINTIVDESLNLAYHGARAEKPGFNIALQRDLDPSVGMADVYPQEITRVLLNIISNGFYAVSKRKAEAGERFEPTLAAVTKNLGDKIEIRIRDNGTGISDAVKEKIFNPFFTTKPAGEGTGLGLSISHDIIVKQHGGSIDVDTEPGLFTEFKIVLPRSS
jgi:two-component system NtrC family sensor kinase